jgi:hypothetical protein
MGPKPRHCNDLLAASLISFVLDKVPLDFLKLHAPDFKPSGKNYKFGPIL